MSAAGRLSLNPFAFRASAEPSVAAHRYAPCSVSIPLLSGPVLNYSDILDIAGNPEVSIPLLSGPVLNRVERRKYPPDRVSIPLLSGPVLNTTSLPINRPRTRLNPFAFRASAEHTRVC